MKKLQVALDLFDEVSTFEALEQVGEYVDIIELGTPLMIAEGAQIIKKVKDKYPNKIVFADIKVMDGGGIVPEVAYKNGADMISVLAVADDATVKAAIDLARRYNRLVLVDMCNVQNYRERAEQISAWNPDYICVHVGTDIQATGVSPLTNLRLIEDLDCKKAIAGGININTFEDACKSAANDIIVGSGLYKSANPKETAQKMYEIINKYRGENNENN